MKKIELPIGLDVKDTYTYLSSKKEKLKEDVMGSFNGKYVDSTMTEDEIYKSITGKSKSEIDKEKKELYEKSKKHREELLENLPYLKKEYLREAATAYYFKKEMFNDFNDILELHLKSIYSDLNIRCMLDICKVLTDYHEDKAQALNKAKELFYEQGHSNNTARITASLVSLYSPYYGTEFYEFVYLG